MKSHNRKLQVDNDGIYAIPSSPSPPSGAPPQQQPIKPFDSSMALTVLVLFTVLFFMGFISIYIRRFSDGSTPINNSRYNRQRIQDPPNIYPFNSVRKGLEPEIISSLPLFYYHEDAKYQIDCSICLGELQEQEVVKMIPYCKHVFHVECIDRWLSLHATCPVCRNTRFLVADYGGGGCFLLAELTVDHGASVLQGGSTVGNANTRDDVTREWDISGY